jgi:hypothetical protein
MRFGTLHHWIKVNGEARALHDGIYYTVRELSGRWWMAEASKEADKKGTILGAAYGSMHEAMAACERSALCS